MSGVARSRSAFVVLVACVLGGLPSLARAAAPTSHKRPSIVDKTLVAWVSPANLTQRGGGVLTLDDQAGNFDGIVFGELAPAKWMAGSNFYLRTQKEQRSYPAETADSKTTVQVAIVYHGTTVTLYRNGKQTAQYQIQRTLKFAPGAAAILGLRHFQAGGGGFFAGTVDDARVYTEALNAEQIAALQPNEPSEPRPAAWFSFADGKAVDRMGKFSVVELMGGACVAGGKLHLDGKGAYLVGNEVVEPQYASPIHYRPRRGVFADPIPFYWNGEYHVFYLRGAAGPVPWEHIVSRDLVHWKELPTALKVDGAHDGPDGGAMFTGSVVHGEGQFHIFYTGDNGGNPKGNEFIMHATSPDLITWTKHPRDMLAPDPAYYKHGPIRDFRDPHVSWNEKDNCYWMVFFANDAKTGAGVQGRAVSKDLVHWQFQPPLPGAGGQECPDLFQIGDTWYLIGGDHYSIAKDPHGPFSAPPVSAMIDRPFIYAAKRMFDGQRHIWTGWLWDRAGFCDNGQPQWGGTQCLPREIYAGPGGQLYSRPAAEVSAVFTRTVLDLAQKPPLTLRSTPWGYAGTALVGRSLGGGSDCTLEVPDHYMLQCKVQMDPKAVFTLALRETDEPNSGYRLVLCPQKQEATITSAEFHDPPRPIELDASKPITIQAFVQGSMIETFINDQYALSCRAYDYPAGKLGFTVSGGEAKLLELKVKVPAGSASKP